MEKKKKESEHIEQHKTNKRLLKPEGSLHNVCHIGRHRIFFLVRVLILLSFFCCMGYIGRDPDVL